MAGDSDGGGGEEVARHREQSRLRAAGRARVEELRTEQHGLISRRQALGAGMTRVEIARLLRRREWVAVHAGVYIGHNGPLGWDERAWAAVLWAEPAALTLRSAVRAAEGAGRRGDDDDVIHVAVARHRRLVAPAGVMVHRTGHLDVRVAWNLSPPRVRYSEAVLDLAARATDDLSAIAVLADACGSRRTSAQRLLDTLASRPWIPRRAWLESILTDVASGTCSVLEHGYLDLVERPHGLPLATRQKPRPTRGGGTLLDAIYEKWQTLVELDGRIFHSSSEARSDDMDRDLDNAVERDEITLRIGYRQVFRDPCSTAERIGQVLARRGWPGTVTACEKCGALDQPG